MAGEESCKCGDECDCCEDEFDGHPYGIITGLDPDYGAFADRYVILYGPEMVEHGIYWELDGFPAQEYHGSGFLIKFNPKFDHSKKSKRQDQAVDVM